MSNTFTLGNKGEAVIKMGLDKVYKLVKEVPKEIETQLEWGDLLIVGNPYIGLPKMKIEVKTEQKHTGNLFFETFSNVHTNRKGWAFTSTADMLFYLFWDEAKGYLLKDFQNVKFLFDYHKTSFREVDQGKHEQNNLTRGKLVPISWLRENFMGIMEFDFSVDKKAVEDAL